MLRISNSVSVPVREDLGASSLQDVCMHDSKRELNDGFGASIKPFPCLKVAYIKEFFSGLLFVGLKTGLLG